MVAAERDGSRRADFEIGDRSEQTFLRLYERLPESQWYGADGYRVYGDCLRIGIGVGKGGAVNWNEGLHSWSRGKLHGCIGGRRGTRKRSDAGEFAGLAAGGLARKILCQFMLRIPPSPPLLTPPRR